MSLGVGCSLGVVKIFVREEFWKPQARQNLNDCKQAEKRRWWGGGEGATHSTAQSFLQNVADYILIFPYNSVRPHSTE